MAIVEMKRIELLAMRQDQRKLLKAMQKMGCVEVSPIKDEALKAYQGKDSARLQQLDSLMERLRWTIGQLSQYNKQKAPFMGNLPDAEPQEIAYIQNHEAEMIAIIDKAEGLEKTGGGEFPWRLPSVRPAGILVFDASNIPEMPQNRAEPEEKPE